MYSSGVIGLTDNDLVRLLRERDGDLPRRRHQIDGRCPYPGDLYTEGDCPWCAAETRQTDARIPSERRIRCMYSDARTQEGFVELEDSTIEPMTIKHIVEFLSYEGTAPTRNRWKQKR